MAYENASNQRKEMIASGFKEMLQRKSLSKISVSELTRQCGVNRKTFYYHFEDIYALLKWTMEQETFNIIRQYDVTVNYDRIIGCVIDYMDKNHTMLYNIYDSMGRNQLHNVFFVNMRGVMESLIDGATKAEEYRITDEYKTFLIDFYTEGIVGSIMQEISKPTQHRKEILSSYVFVTFRGGILKSLQDAQESNL